MRKLSKISMLAVAALMSLAVAGRADAPLENRVPQDAMVYVGWAGGEALAGQYAGSNLKVFVEASAAAKYISEQLPKLIAMAGQNDPQAPKIIEKLQAGLGVAWRHPTAFYFCPVDFKNPQKPELRFGLMCEAGAEAGTLAALLKEAVASLPPQQELPMAVNVEGTLVSLTFGKAQATLPGAGGALAANATYKKVMGQFKVAKPAVAMYVDFPKGMELFKEALAKVPGPNAQEQAMVLKVVDLLGLNGLKQMAMVSGFDGKEWSGQAFLGVEGAPKGVLGLMGSQPLSDGVLNVVPKEAASFSTMKLDLPKVYGEVRKILGQIDANTLKELDTGLARMTAQLGFNVEQDVLAPLGEEWVFYMAPLSELGGNSYALVHKLRDNDRFAATLTKVEALVNRAGGAQFKIDKAKSGNIEYSTITIQDYSVAWTVRGGYLYLSSMDGIAGAVKQVENKLPNITASDLYQKALAQVNVAGAKPVAISYANPAKLYPEIRRTLVGLLPLARAVGVDIPAALLPDVDTVRPVLTPGASISWWDAEGLHESSHSSFPGVTVMGGGGGGPLVTVAALSVGTAVLLPALGQSRELAMRSTDAMNLRGIGMASIVSAVENNDKMPDDLAKLVADGIIAPKQLVSKRAGTEPLVMTPELEKMAKDDFAKYSAQVAAHCDFVYLGKGTKNNADAGIIIAYEKPGPHVRDGMNMVFGDGHAEFVRFGGLAAVFGPTNEMLTKAGRPTVDVQDILRKCNAPVAVTPAGAPIRITPNAPGQGMP